MKLTCLRENLSRTLATAGGAVPSRTAMDMLLNFLIDARDGQLRVTATNLETTIIAWTPAQVETPGTTSVPARLFGEFIGTLADGPVEIEVPEGSGVLRIAQDRNVTNINAANPRDFPPVPETGGEEQAADIEARKLHAGIQHVAFAAAEAQDRPVLTGVELHMEAQTMKMAAADGFRLAVYQTGLETPVPGDIRTIIPAKTLGQVERLARGQEEPVRLAVGTSSRTGAMQGKQIVFSLQDARIISSLLEGTFPDYERLIPQDNPMVAVLDTRELRQAARTTEAFAKNDAGVTKLEITSQEDGTGKLVMSSKSQETGSNTVELPAEITRGQEQQIAFNSRYIKELLGAVGEEKITLEASSSSSPGVFRTGGPEEAGEYTHVIMPMFINW